VRDLQTEIRKGNKKTLKQVTDNLAERKSSYFRSRCFTALQTRYRSLANSRDMVVGSPGSNDGGSGSFNNRNRSNIWKSNVIFPLVKERQLVRAAIFAQNFRNDPLFTLTPLAGTTKESAFLMQTVLNMNLRATQFRAKAFRNMIDSTSNFGSSVMYSVWQESGKMVWKTVPSPDGGVERKKTRQIKTNALNKMIHILDYMQDDFIPDGDASSFQGHMDHRMTSELIAAWKRDQKITKEFGTESSYIKENIESVIKELKEAHHISDSDKFKPNADMDFSKKGVDVAVFYAQIPVSGNEGNLQNYYVEMVNNKVIRFQDNPLDDDLRPYAVTNIYARSEYWWGNADSELVVPHENFTNLIMGMKADRALQSLQQYIMYGKGTIDAADWNQRHINGGLVPVNLKPGQTLSKMLHQFQPQDTSLTSTDSIQARVDESAARMTPRPDFSRKAAKGGLQNSTATAALILEEQSDVLETYILESFQFGVKRIALNNTELLMQNLDMEFAIRPETEQQQMIVNKREILGAYDVMVETSLTKNKASELERVQNAITGILNMKGTGEQALQTMNLVPLFRDWIKKLDVGNVDDLLPQQAEQEAPGAVPSIQTPGAEFGGAVTGVTPAPPEAEGVSVTG